MTRVVITLCIGGLCFLAWFTIRALNRDILDMHESAESDRRLVKELNQYLERQGDDGGPNHTP